MAKFLKHSSGSLVEDTSIATSAGVGDATKLPHLDISGKLDASFMPAGLMADVMTFVANGALAAGDFVYIDATGKAAKADASNPAKKAQGYVLAAVTNGANASVYFDDINSALTGLTAGSEYYLSATTPGTVTATPPSASGNIVQKVGFAKDANNIHVRFSDPIQLV